MPDARGSEYEDGATLGVVSFTPDALEDLNLIGDSIATAEILDLAERELRLVNNEGPIEGVTADEYQHRMMWRRAVRMNDLHDFMDDEIDFEEHAVQACDYVIVYHKSSNFEVVRLMLNKPKFIVDRVLHTADFRRLINARLSGDA